MLFKYKPRTRFELLKPFNNLSIKVELNNDKEIPIFIVGDIVWCKNLKEGKGWTKAVPTCKWNSEIFPHF